MLPRRYSRLAILGLISTALLLATMLVVDSYFNVLPTSIQTRMPLHVMTPVVVDVSIKTCKLTGGCPEPESGWHKIPKDLYLNSKWLNHGFLYAKFMSEEDLDSSTPVVLMMGVAEDGELPVELLKDIQRVSSGAQAEDVASTLNRAIEAGWRCVDAKFGVWAKFGKHVPNHAVTAINVLFGNDAVYPVPGWTLLRGNMAVETPVKPRIVVRIGPASAIPKPQLTVNNQHFKIVQMADLHMSTGPGECRDPGFESVGSCHADELTVEFMDTVLDLEKPDLVVYTGDQVFGNTAPDPETALLKALAPAIQRGIPFALVFGNHDSQGPLDNAAQMAIVERLPYSLAESGPSLLSGVGNYVLTAAINGKPALTLYFLDSHAYTKVKGVPQYDWIHEDQLNFVSAEYAKLKHLQKEYSHFPLSMAFFHIPLPEYMNAGARYGDVREGVAAPRHNSGALRVLASVGVSVLSVGHDHLNDFCKWEDSVGEPVWLCYGGGGGEGGYGGDPDHRGQLYERRIRIFDIDTQASSIISWKRIRGHSEIVDKQILVNNGAPVLEQM